MSEGGPDLTGRWTGVYFYPDDSAWNANDNYPPTPFTAELVDDHGVIIGSTLASRIMDLENIGSPTRQTLEFGDDLQRS